MKATMNSALSSLNKVGIAFDNLLEYFENTCATDYSENECSCEVQGVAAPCSWCETDKFNHLFYLDARSKRGILDEIIISLGHLKKTVHDVERESKENLAALDEVIAVKMTLATKTLRLIDETDEMETHYKEREEELLAEIAELKRRDSYRSPKAARKIK